MTENDQSMERTRQTEQRVNTVCVQCNREFGTLHGLKVHQGKTCLKKKRQCGSSDRKTRSKSSQDENHSGSIMVSVNSPSTQALSEADLQTHESGARKPKILWPAANEKTKYKALEDKVMKIVREERKNDTMGGAKESLGRFSEIIYETASEEFGCKDMKKKTTEKSKVMSRRQTELVVREL